MTEKQLRKFLAKVGKTCGKYGVILKIRKSEEDAPKIAVYKVDMEDMTAADEFIADVWISEFPGYRMHVSCPKCGWENAR